MPPSRWTPRSGKYPCTCADARSNCATNPSSGQSWRSGTRRSSLVWAVAATKISTPKPMAPPIMSAEKLPLAIALKTLWGATEMPFGDACAEPYRHPNFEELIRRLQQLCEIGASGLLHGPNGIWQKLSLRLLYRQATRKTIQNPLAGSLLAHRQRPHPLLVPSIGRPTPDAPQRQRGSVPRISSA